jgi:sec-independent protein translocase protein TatA
MMGLDNPVHLAFLFMLLLLVFGAKRLPEIGRSLGTGMREFKQSVTGDGGSHGQEGQAQPTLPPATVQAQAGGQAVQQPGAAPAAVPSSAQASAQDAFAQREQGSGE